MITRVENRPIFAGWPRSVFEFDIRQLSRTKSFMRHAAHERGFQDIAAQRSSSVPVLIFGKLVRLVGSRPPQPPLQGSAEDAVCE
jgi:hypothetical protein